MHFRPSICPVLKMCSRWNLAIHRMPFYPVIIRIWKTSVWVNHLHLCLKDAALWSVFCCVSARICICIWQAMRKCMTIFPNFPSFWSMKTIWTLSICIQRSLSQPVTAGRIFCRSMLPSAVCSSVQKVSVPLTWRFTRTGFPNTRSWQKPCPICNRSTKTIRKPMKSWYFPSWKTLRSRFSAMHRCPKNFPQTLWKIWMPTKQWPIKMPPPMNWISCAADSAQHFTSCIPRHFLFPAQKTFLSLWKCSFISVLLTKNCADRKMPFISMISALPTAIGKARRSILSTIIWCWS